MMGRRLVVLVAGTAAVALAAVAVTLTFRPSGASTSSPDIVSSPAPTPTPPVAAPYAPPAVVRAIYLTSSTARSPARLASLVSLIERTELNAIVINVNDGRTLVPRGELAAIVRDLNARGVYTIARITAFQNEALALSNPELTLRQPGGGLWRDGGGHRWVDPSSEAVWEALRRLSEAAATAGFRELNYDYIRFPSDGDVGRAVYPAYDRARPKADVIVAFGRFLREHLKARHPDLVLSADVFAHTLLVEDDAGIGQRFLDLVQTFDVVAPMAYPSHYRAGNFGFRNPAVHPHEVVARTLAAATAKLAAAGQPPATVRPWLQDFTLGATYTAAMVREEIRAVEGAGFGAGWMLWNPRNVYTEAALAAE